MEMVLGKEQETECKSEKQTGKCQKIKSRISQIVPKQTHSKKR